MHWRNGVPNGTTVVTNEYPLEHTYSVAADAGTDLRQYWPPNGTVTSEYPVAHTYFVDADAGTDFSHRYPTTPGITKNVTRS